MSDLRGCPRPQSETDSAQTCQVLGRRRTGLLILSVSAVAIGAAMWARDRSGPRTSVPATASQTGDENAELLRRLVHAVEGYRDAAADDRAAREIDRNRERRAIWVVIWTLLSLLWLDGVQG